MATPIEEVVRLTKLSNRELYKTFNMGVGLMIVTDNQDVMDFLKKSGLGCWVLGEVTNRFKGIRLKGEALS